MFLRDGGGRVGGSTENARPEKDEQGCFGTWGKAHHGLAQRHDKGPNIRQGSPP